MFCDFHKVIINKDKSDYITMNHMINPPVQVRWTPVIQYENEAEREDMKKHMEEQHGKEIGQYKFKQWIKKHNPMGQVFQRTGKAGRVPKGHKRDMEDNRTIK